MLKPIATDIWAQDSEVKLVPGMRMPCRATILRLPDGGLAIHSPLAIDDATARAIDALGEVRYLVAPNRVHWMFLKAAKARYPQARVFGAPGLTKKLGDLPFEPLPERGVVGGLTALRTLRIDGAPAIDEHAFFHEPSRSLIVTDLMFNIHASRSFGMRLYLRLGSAWKKTAQSFVWRLLVRDRAAAARCASELLGWEFERVVVAHGDVVEDDARARARDALTWMTRGVPPLLSAGSAR